MGFGVAVLAGGLSSRMGIDKAALKIDGVRFLDRLAFELCGFDEFLVSVDKKSRRPGIPYPAVEDALPRCGPIGALYSVLNACKSDELLVVPCDVPLFSRKLAREMHALLDSATDAVIAEDAGGRTHPLCGVYKKQCKDVLLKYIERGNYRLGDALKELKVKKYNAAQDSWRLTNVNTPEDYTRLHHNNVIGDANKDILEPENDNVTPAGGSMGCLAVCGWKNAGKTTLIERLVSELSKAGLKVGVIKHDGHSYTPDTPGTDSFRFFEAGAYASAVYDGQKFTVTKRRSPSEDELLALMEGADIVLLEGAKQTAYPKLEVIRKSENKGVIENLAGRLAFVSELTGLPNVAPVFRPDDIPGITRFVLESYKCGALNMRY